ncbi:hypothetical protein AWB79_07505 [Caballeronia hypogeia]|uniref:Lipoprotein n=1 Tax=Caballeronia hypogeia TaxID=1777140 RepID=A0A158DTE7_9BURK|nr:hypothetical protein [Caballeronia hypogeia]SAK97710.1 hypothetical protein AWB79_07505 [Caballeronia hypogeia]
MNKLYATAVAVLLAVSVTGALAAQPSKKPHAAAQSTKASGPAGYGALRLGMSRTDVEALQASDGIYLTDALTVAAPNEKFPLRDGEEAFDAHVMTPVGTDATGAHLTFTNGKLTSLTIDLDSFQSQEVSKQLAGKYGTGTADDDMQEEECRYGNGTNFKISYGIQSIVWRQRVSSTREIATTLSNLRIEMCPASLRSPKIGPIERRWVNLKIVDPQDEAKKNLF